MNKFSLAFTFGMATQAALAAPTAPASQRQPGPAVDKKARPATVVLPSALQRERKVGLTLSMGKGRRMRLGLLTGPRALKQSLPFGTSAPARQLAGVEYDHRTNWGYTNLRFGALRNGNPLLGKARHDNSLIKPADRTTFSSISVGYALGPKLDLVGTAAFGRTSGARNDFDGIDTVRASAGVLSIGLSSRDLIARGDFAGIALIAPTRAVGFANVDGSPGAPHGVALGARYSIHF